MFERQGVKLHVLVECFGGGFRRTVLYVLGGASVFDHLRYLPAPSTSVHYKTGVNAPPWSYYLFQWRNLNLQYPECESGRFITKPALSNVGIIQVHYV